MYDKLLEGEPLLMPKQASPFNGDHFVAAQFLKLKNKFKIDRVIECGTCVGGSAKWFGENFDYVETIEIEKSFQEIAKQRCAGLQNILFRLGSTVKVLPEALEGTTDRTLVFIDSHWAEHFPLFDELIIIKEAKIKPVIVIHDFKVPNEPALGYDSYKCVDICFEEIERYLDDIYGKGGYEYHFNSDAESTEIKRGLFYCYPNS